MQSAPLLDREFLEKLERLALRWQKSFPGLVGGHNQSRFAGAGQEFLDHRSFHLGDDLRAVNWRAYLRLEKLFLKMFQVEPRVPVRMLVDTSDSMQPVASSITRGAWPAPCVTSEWCGWTASSCIRLQTGWDAAFYVPAGGIASVRCWIRLPRWNPAGPPTSSRFCASSSAATRNAA